MSTVSKDESTTVSEVAAGLVGLVREGRFLDAIDRYTVEGGKLVRELFFYPGA